MLFMTLCVWRYKKEFINPMNSNSDENKISLQIITAYWNIQGINDQG